MTKQELAEKYLIFKCIAGSRSYGTNSAHSDVDIRGVFIAPPEYTIGCLKSVEQVEIPGEDTVIYELAKFVKLAVKCNPNIIELLFTDDENILMIDPAFETLRAHRHLFLSQTAKFTFGGYATAQMKRICGHRNWINQEQKGIAKLRKLWEERKITEQWLTMRFSTPVVKKVTNLIESEHNSQNIPVSEMDKYLRDEDVQILSKEPPVLLKFASLILPNGKIVDGTIIEDFLNVFLVKVNSTVFRVFASTHVSKPPLSADRQNIQFIDIKEDRLAQDKSLEFYGTLIIQRESYQTQCRIWKNYQKWKKERNKKRAALEEQHGFDTKHAMHLIRLLRMSREIFTENKIKVRRPDADELVAIREGAFSYDQLMKEIEHLNKELEYLYKTSMLPDSVNKEAVNDLYIQIVQQYWAQHGLS